MFKQSRVVIYVIKASTILKFIVIEGIVGTGAYYGIELSTSSAFIAFVGSIVVIEGIKWAGKFKLVKW